MFACVTDLRVPGSALRVQSSGSAFTLAPTECPVPLPGTLTVRAAAFVAVLAFLLHFFGAAAVAWRLRFCGGQCSVRTTPAHHQHRMHAFSCLHHEAATR